MKPGTRKSPCGRSAAARRPAWSRRRRPPPAPRGRRRVPFRGRREPRIDVGRAFRHPAEFDRRAADHALGRRQPRQKGLGRGIEMRAADQRRRRRWPATAGSGSASRSLAALAARPAASASRSAPPADGRRARPARAPARRRCRAIGRPSVTSAMLTVNSSRPASNSRVPSSGSTRMKRPPRAPAACAGRLLRHHRHAGQQPRKPSRMTASAASSAAVTGERSALARASSAPARTARIAAAAARHDAPSVRRAAPRRELDVHGVPASRCSLQLSPWQAERRGVSHRRARAMTPDSRSALSPCVPIISHTGDILMSGPVALEAPRSRRAAVLARLPRPDQPGRRHRQRPRSDGRGAERRGDQDLRAWT